MSDSPEQSWSNHTNAPQIPPWLYTVEKDYFAGYLIGAISYGIVIALFFQCMGVLFSPANSTKKVIKWSLVVHTMAMFSFLTVSFGMFLNWVSVEYINNRDFPGIDEYLPGPYGYANILCTGALHDIHNVMFPLNQWLADGLLLHRCYVIYSMSHWVMAFPYLMYLASVAVGISNVYERLGMNWETARAVNFSTSYYSISLALNVTLTSMIIIRVILHRRELRRALGASDGLSGVYTAITTMIIESYALYAVTLLAYTIPWAIDSPVLEFFSGAVGPIQGIAPYLIIIRVAKRRAVTSDSISRSFESMRFRSQGSTDDDGPLPDGDPTNATEVNSEAPGEPSARDENAIEEVPS